MIIRTLFQHFLILFVLGLGACATTQPDVGDEPAKRQLSDVLQEGDEVAVKAFYDPWEGYNHWMYNFNAKFDRYIFIPTVNAYKTILPGFTRTGIHNAFKNLGEISNLANSLLQAKPKQFGLTFGRFVVNSTIGIGGLLDPATKMGLYHQNEDFGQTLGHWGVGPGPYFMMPILGPSTLRDAPSNIVDRIFHPVYEPAPWLVEIKSEEQLAIGVVNAIDTRANIGFRYYEMGSPFEYYWTRNLWLEYRQLEISK
jgi:phospholipid-binding lipoprotein MlaA